MTRLTIAACIAAMVATTAAAVAQDYANITVAGDVVARIRTGGPYGGIYQRQARIDQRIVNVLDNERENIFVQELNGPDLDVYQADGRWTLSIGDTMIIQAFPEDAVGTTTKELIYQWQENFKRQLPRAVSPIHVPGWWVDPHAEEGGVTGQREHGAAAEDLPLVREVAAILQAARETPDDSFEEMVPCMEQALLQTIWTYRHPSCGDAPITKHIRASSALKRAKGLDEARYRYEKYWLAKVTIDKLRDAMDMPAGVGPVPEQRDLPDFETPIPSTDTDGIASGPDTTEPPAIDAARILPGTPLERVALGTGLGADNALLDVGQHFAMDTSQLLVYVEVKGAPQNTIVGVTMEDGEHIIARRLVRVSGDRRMAVTFYPARATTFTPGDYVVKLTVNGNDAGVIPFRIGPREE